MKRKVGPAGSTVDAEWEWGGCNMQPARRSRNNNSNYPTTTKTYH